MNDKTILIVLAHEEPKSFCASLKNIALTQFKARGYNVIESDLYQMNFDPLNYEMNL